MKVFISQPMRGKTDNEIMEEKQRITEYIHKTYDDVEIINSFFNKDNPINELLDHPTPMEYLSISLLLLSKAQLAMIPENWRLYRGCTIEKLCCDFYNIPYETYLNEE